MDLGKPARSSPSIAAASRRELGLNGLRRRVDADAFVAESWEPRRGLKSTVDLALNYMKLHVRDTLVWLTLVAHHFDRLQIDVLAQKGALSSLQVGPFGCGRYQSFHRQQVHVSILSDRLFGNLAQRQPRSGGIHVT
jgi:hypothetical protein